MESGNRKISGFFILKKMVMTKKQKTLKDSGLFEWTITAYLSTNR